jgi:hypothetical protein
LEAIVKTKINRQCIPKEEPEHSGPTNVTDDEFMPQDCSSDRVMNKPLKNSLSPSSELKELKDCNLCGKTLPVSEFAKTASWSSTPVPYCKKCMPVVRRGVKQKIKVPGADSSGTQHVLQAERQKVGQEPDQQTGYKARVNQNHLEHSMLLLWHKCVILHTLFRARSYAAMHVRLASQTQG